MANYVKKKVVIANSEPEDRYQWFEVDELYTFAKSCILPSMLFQKDFEIYFRGNSTIL